MGVVSSTSFINGEIVDSEDESINQTCDCETTKPRKSKLAIASLVISVLALVFYAGSLALVSLDNCLPLWMKSWIPGMAFGMLVGSLVLVSLLIAFFGAILGALALIRIRRSRRQLIGKVEATLGLVIGAGFFIFNVMMLTLVFISFLLEKT